MSCDVDSPPPTARITPQDLDQEPRDRVERKRGREDLTVVALAGQDEEEADRCDCERRGRLVDLRGVHGLAPHAHALEEVRLRLLLARRAARREREPHGSRWSGRSSSPRAGSPCARTRAPSGSRSRPCRRPSRTGSDRAASRNTAADGRADEAAVIGEAAGPELRPREAVARLRMTHALRGIPHAVVRASRRTRRDRAASRPSTGSVQRCT